MKCKNRKTVETRLSFVAAFSSPHPFVAFVLSESLGTRLTNNRLASVVSALILQILHSTIFTTSQLLLLTSSFANAVLTPHMGVAYSYVIYSC